MYVVILIAVALLVGLAKGGFGPMGALIVPLLSTQMPVSTAVGVVLPLLILGDWFAMRAYWRQWDTRLVKLLLPGAVVGIALGLTLLTSLSDDALRRLLGVFTLVVAAYKLASDSITRVTYQPHNWHGTVAGSASGFASALANAGGPPITAYLLLQKLPPATFVATNVLFFAIVNLIKLPAFVAADVIDAHKLLRIAWVLPLIPLGVWIGRKLVARINRTLFEWLMLAGLVWAGLSLLLG